MASANDGTATPPEDTKMVVDFDLVRRISGRNLRDLGGHPSRDGKRVKANTSTARPIWPQFRLRVRHAGSS